jgi:hypothetical protein
VLRRSRVLRSSFWEYSERYLRFSRIFVFISQLLFLLIYVSFEWLWLHLAFLVQNRDVAGTHDNGFASAGQPFVRGHPFMNHCGRLGFERWLPPVMVRESCNNSSPLYAFVEKELDDVTLLNFHRFDTFQLLCELFPAWFSHQHASVRFLFTTTNDGSANYWCMTFFLKTMATGGESGSISNTLY